MIIKNKTGIVITIIMAAALSIGTVACGNVTSDSANSPIDDASSMPADTSQESVNQSNAEKTQENEPGSEGDNESDTHINREIQTCNDKSVQGDKMDLQSAGSEPAGNTGDLSPLTEEQVFNAVVEYCTEYYQLDALPEQTNYYWTVETLSDQECLVRFRSYTGAFVNYYVDVVSGEVHATNDVPALNITGEPSDERFNVRDYLD